MNGMGSWAQAEYDIAKIVRAEMEAGITVPMYGYKLKVERKNLGDWCGSPGVTLPIPNKSEIYEVAKNKQHRPLFSRFDQKLGIWFGICESPEAAFKSTIPSKDMINGTVVAWRNRVGEAAKFKFTNLKFQIESSKPVLFNQNWISFDVAPTETGVYEVLHSNKTHTRYSHFGEPTNNNNFNEYSLDWLSTRHTKNDAKREARKSSYIASRIFTHYRKIPGETYNPIDPIVVTDLSLPSGFTPLHINPLKNGIYEIKHCDLSGVWYSKFLNGEWMVAYPSIEKAEDCNIATRRDNFIGWKYIEAIRIHSFNEIPQNEGVYQIITVQDFVCYSRFWLGSWKKLANTFDEAKNAIENVPPHALNYWKGWKEIDTVFKPFTQLPEKDGLYELDSKGNSIAYSKFERGTWHEYDSRKENALSAVRSSTIVGETSYFKGWREVQS